MRTISKSDLSEAIDAGSAVVIDVLPKQYYDKQHIPSAVNIPLDSADFLAKVEDAVGDKSNNVVVYCASNACDSSVKAYHQLEKAGFSNVQEYAGGTAEWFGEASACSTEGKMKGSCSTSKTACA